MPLALIFANLMHEFLRSERRRSRVASAERLRQGAREREGEGDHGDEKKSKSSPLAAPLKQLFSSGQRPRAAPKERDSRRVRGERASAKRQRGTTEAYVPVAISFEVRSASNGKRRAVSR